MEKTGTENTKATIEYKIDSINIINHSQTHFSEYGLSPSDFKTGDCKIGIDIVVEADKSCIAIPMKVEMFVASEGKKYALFCTEAIYRYKIKKFKSLFMTSDPDKFEIPDAFMRTLIGTALSGMRGIMVASTTIAEYKKIILPLIGTSQLLEEIKKKDSEGVSSAESISN